jgi:arsenite methyltransferase
MANISNPAIDLSEAEIVELYDELPLWSAPFGLELLDNIIYRKDMNVLDIGFGGGFPFLIIAQRLGHSCKVYGLEPNKAAYDKTAKKIDLMGLKNAHILQTTAEEMSFDDAFFDMIVSNNGLNNVQDIEHSFRNCSRFANKGCRFIFTMNLPGTMNIFYEQFRNAVGNLPLSGLDKEIDSHVYSKRKPLTYLENITEKNGFKILKKIEKSFSMNYLDGAAFLNDFLIRSAFMPLWLDIVPNEFQQNVFDEIEKQLNDIAYSYGFLKLDIPYVCIVAEKS